MSDYQNLPRRLRAEDVANDEARAFDPHLLGYCCRYASNLTCVGCGDETNGDETNGDDAQADLIRKFYRQEERKERRHQLICKWLSLALMAAAFGLGVLFCWGTK